MLLLFDRTNKQTTLTTTKPNQKKNHNSFQFSFVCLTEHRVFVNHDGAQCGRVYDNFILFFFPNSGGFLDRPIFGSLEIDSTLEPKCELWWNMQIELFATVEMEVACGTVVMWNSSTLRPKGSIQIVNSAIASAGQRNRFQMAPPPFHPNRIDFLAKTKRKNTSRSPIPLIPLANCRLSTFSANDRSNRSLPSHFALTRTTLYARVRANTRQLFQRSEFLPIASLSMSWVSIVTLYWPHREILVDNVCVRQLYFVRKRKRRERKKEREKNVIFVEKFTAKKTSLIVTI